MTRSWHSAWNDDPLLPSSSRENRFINRWMPFEAFQSSRSLALHLLKFLFTRISQSAISICTVSKNMQLLGLVLTVLFVLLKTQFAINVKIPRCSVQILLVEINVHTNIPITKTALKSTRAFLLTNSIFTCRHSFFFRKKTLI